MSQTQQAICCLIDVFQTYSGKEGDKNTLSKAELKELLQNELGGVLGKADDKAAVDRIFQELDANKDSSVDFKEFGVLVMALASVCHDAFCKK